jgi:group I intron endonuclease
MKSITKQYHYLYKITNLINNKIYIGIHSTNKLDDGYFGSGKHILQAVKKYGKQNFKKEILEWFDWKCEALNREAQIVNKEFIERSDTYNLKLGGEQALLFSDETYKKFGKHRINVPSWNKGLIGLQIGHMKGKKHTNETLTKMKNCKVGNLNPMFGKEKTEDSLIKMRKPKSKIAKSNIKAGNWIRNLDSKLTPSAKPCIINNKKFECAKDAYKELNMNISLCAFRVKVRNGYNGWHYLEV